MNGNFILPAMSDTYHYAIFIGRFQPFHIGHLFVFEAALKQAKQLIVLVGSSGGARSLRNPWTFAERAELIRSALPPTLRDKVTLLPLHDYTYNDNAWVNAVTETVENHVSTTNLTPSIALVGHDKDETTYYLRLFPHWDYIEVGNLAGINATRVRHNYFKSTSPHTFASDILLPATQQWLQQFAKTKDFAELVAEFRAIEHFKSSWSNTPYPVIFTTTDALVRYHNEILLITRKHYPGKDLLALPGGFLDKEETLYDSCIRELTEETHLAVSSETLHRALVRHEVFDNPKRSTRGRIVTCCYYFDLSFLTKKPKAYADDDAKSLTWLTISTLPRERFFEDHYFIIQQFINPEKGVIND